MQGARGVEYRTQGVAQWKHIWQVLASSFPLSQATYVLEDKKGTLENSTGVLGDGKGRAASLYC